MKHFHRVEFNSLRVEFNTFKFSESRIEFLELSSKLNLTLIFFTSVSLPIVALNFSVSILVKTASLS
jgi:hypothetical protein